MKRLACSCLLAAVALNARAEVRYYVVDFEALWGKSCSASALNNLGEVAGSFSTGKKGENHAFRYFNGEFTDLGTLGGPDSYAADMNDSGAVIGKAQDKGLAYHVVLWSRTGMTDLGVLGGAWPQIINSSGDFVGTVLDDNGYHPFLYQSGVMTDLGATIGRSNVFLSGFNDAGQIVGSRYVGSYGRAFLYSGGTVTDIATQIGLSDTSLSTASAINQSGQIVGNAEFTDGSTYQPFLYSGGTLTRLDEAHTFSTANDINDSGDIVGRYNGERLPAAYLYEAGSLLRLKDLISPSLPYDLAYSTRINNDGWILCSGYNSSTYLLVPLDTSISPPSLQPLGKKRIVVSRPRLALSGRARGKVISVSYRIGGRVYRIAEGTNRWSFSIGLKGIRRTSLTMVAHGPGGDSASIRIPVIVK